MKNHVQRSAIDILHVYEHVVIIVFQVHENGTRDVGIDGPAITDEEGRYAVTERVAASCSRLFGIFESEADITDGSFRPVITVFLDIGGELIQTLAELENAAPDIEFTDVAGFGVRMVAQMPPLTIDSNGGN